MNGFLNEYQKNIEKSDKPKFIEFLKSAIIAIIITVLVYYAYHKFMDTEKIDVRTREAREKAKELRSSEERAKEGVY